MNRVLKIFTVIMFLSLVASAQTDLFWEKLVKVYETGTYITTRESEAIGLGRFAYNQDGENEPLFVVVLANKKNESINLRKSRAFAIDGRGDPVYFELLRHRNSNLEESLILKPLAEICLVYAAPIKDDAVNNIKNIYIELYNGKKIRIVSESIFPEKPYNPFEIIKPIDDFWKKLREWFLITPQ